MYPYDIEDYCEMYQVLDVSDPLYDDPELDDRIILTEAINPSKVSVGEVYEAVFPFMDFNGRSKNRRVLIIDIGDGILRGLMMSTIKEDDPRSRKKAYSRYNYMIKKPLENGFSKRVFAVGSVFFKLEYLTILHKTGTMSKSNYDNCIEKVRLFIDDKFNSPWTFANWIKNEAIQNTIPIRGDNNNSNPLQTLKDIEISKRANCVDIASAVHTICEDNMENRIVWIIFKTADNKATRGHLFTIWRTASRIYVLRCVTETNELPKLEISDYPSSKYKTVVEEEINFYKPYIDKMIDVDIIEYLIFYKAAISMWDNAVKHREIQNDALNMIKTEFPFTTYYPDGNKSMLSEGFAELLEDIDGELLDEFNPDFFE